MITEMAQTVCSGATMVADNAGDLPIHNLVNPIVTILRCLTYVELQCAGLTVHDDYNDAAAEITVLKVVRCSLYCLLPPTSCCWLIFACCFPLPSLYIWVLLPSAELLKYRLLYYPCTPLPRVLLLINIEIVELLLHLQACE